MSVLYCTIPHFAAALLRREEQDLATQPLILLGPEGRVFDFSAEAAASGILVGMTARAAEIRCPEAQLREANLARCRAELEILFQVLEKHGAEVEPHGWGAAYADLTEQIMGPATVALREIGQAVRRELGEALQPALGWNTSKFTAQAAAWQTQPGRLRAVDRLQEQAFLTPLPIVMLPLDDDALQRLYFLGLRTLGQYAALPVAAVWQQFGRAGKLAHCCARGEDDRPVIPRWQSEHRAAEMEFEAPLTERDRLMAALKHLVSPLLTKLRASLRACGQVRLTVQFEDGSAQEGARTFLQPVAREERVTAALEQLMDGMRWQAGATAVALMLEQIQDAVAQQMSLFPRADEREGKLREVERYLASRFGANRLRRAVLVQPGAPLPEWRAGWL